MSEQTRTEEHQVSGKDLKAKLKEILRQGNVRRVIVRNPDGRTIVDLPLTVGIVGAALMPLWAAIGGIVALTARYVIVVERSDGGGMVPRA